MGVEIERKFLVIGEDWKRHVTDSVRLRDGLVASAGGRKVRVRIAGETATLTVKGRRRGLGRSEFEYAIPLADAEQMLAEFCGRPGRLIEKTRHIIPAGDLKWEVDVFHGLLGGITTAEIELPTADTTFARPDWLGVEVTGNFRFSTRRMVQERSRARWSAGAILRTLRTTTRHLLGRVQIRPQFTPRR
ncbi:CYTH domain-containing protein [Cereibacter sphaeroides]|uniref:CYTH domain-containing protein n=1 Tax=Cereibacter sphaeroides TaxID=1063 RepID=UPI001F1EFC33|nr:CYTH domain-containing protein [Cereibacter sphaeroides]MCE6959824.1 CYTH domain-containing protein [Cereibacter sphaeroides]MCE6968708.1 CYTH domain-containing protein [Cereibacter sphaeroides]MCE6974678.1 CYTH domain-containing protein [Cereibacter sphaeroides]